MKRKIETHHYAARLNEDFLQCAVYDSDKPEARLIGVEYVISEKVFKTLPQEEKQLWHSHEFEIKEGLWVNPGVPEMVATRVWPTPTANSGAPGNSIEGMCCQWEHRR